MKVIADPVFRQEKFIFEETRRGRADFGVGDKGLLLIALLLGGLGLVMVYSASGVLAAKIYQDGAHFLKKQLIWTVLGLFLFWGSARLDVERLRRRLFPFACGIFLLLISALLFGAEINGSRRWVQAGPVGFQPSELAKLFTVVYLSSYIAKKGEGLREFFKGVAPVLVLVGAECALILMEPDLGTTATLLLISAALLFLGGCALRHLTALGLFVLPLFVYWIMKTPYRRERIMVFLNPWSDASASGFQMIQSLLALGSGGAIGTGLGEGRQKLFFLPEPHTDFIFSVIGEELGLLGTLSLLSLFFLLFWKGTQIARSIEAPFERMLAFGTTLMMTLPALMNMGVATGLLPTKGLTLPFVSYGGSSLVVNWIAMGLLFNVSRKRAIGVRGPGAGDRRHWRK